MASPALPATRPKGPADHRGTGEARSRRPAAGRPGQGWGHSGCSLGHTSTRPPSPAECHSSAAWHASPPRGARSPPLQGHNSLHLRAPAPRPPPCPLPTRPQSPGPWLPTQPAVVKVPQPPGQAARRLHSQPPPLPRPALVFQNSEGHPSPGLARQASHPPGTGVPCTLPGSGRRSLCPGPRRCPRSHRGSGSRGRGLKGRRGSLSPITVLPEASGLLGASRLPPAAWVSPARACLCAWQAWPPARCTLPSSQCRPEKPGGQSHLYLPM